MRSVITLAFLAAAAAAQDCIPVVLSTDVGNEVDDQWAIVYLMTQPRFDVKGLLSAHAPTVSPPAAKTTYRILRTTIEERMNMRQHPPILEGSSEPLADTRTPIPSAAADFLLTESRSYTSDRRLNVLTIGAVTDVAAAILRDPSIVNRIRVVDMGFQNWRTGGTRVQHQQ